MFLTEVRRQHLPAQDAWRIIIKLLLTCEVWSDRTWKDLHGQPVFREKNDYELLKNGQPNTALKEATLQGDYIAKELDISRADLCQHIGSYLKPIGKQPNNLLGHAFRSIVSAYLAEFGDPELDILEEQDPHKIFPGISFPHRSPKARVDIAVYRNSNLVCLCSARWSYRHDRVELLEEATTYMPPARRINEKCQFFGVTAEMNPARLMKVINQTTPVLAHAAMTRLVHVHPPLGSTVINHNGGLAHLWSLADWAADSFNWR